MLCTTCGGARLVLACVGEERWGIGSTKTYSLLLLWLCIVLQAMGSGGLRVIDPTMLVVERSQFARNFGDNGVCARETGAGIAKRNARIKQAIERSLSTTMFRFQMSRRYCLSQKPKR